MYYNKNKKQERNDIFMEILRVENLTKIYGKDESQVIALDNVSFTVNKGEFVAIVGASRKWKINSFTFDWRS